MPATSCVFCRSWETVGQRRGVVAGQVQGRLTSSFEAPQTWAHTVDRVREHLESQGVRWPDDWESKLMTYRSESELSEVERAVVDVLHGRVLLKAKAHAAQAGVSQELLDRHEPWLERLRLRLFSPPSLPNELLGQASFGKRLPARGSVR